MVNKQLTLTEYIIFIFLLTLSRYWLTAKPVLQMAKGKGKELPTFIF